MKCSAITQFGFKKPALFFVASLFILGLMTACGKKEQATTKENSSSAIVFNAA